MGRYTIMNNQDFVELAFDTHGVPKDGTTIGRLPLQVFTAKSFAAYADKNPDIKNDYKLFVSKPNKFLSSSSTSDIASFLKSGSTPYVISGNELELRVASVFINAVYDDNKLLEIAKAPLSINVRSLKNFRIPLTRDQYEYAATIQAYMWLMESIIAHTISEELLSKLSFIRNYLSTIRLFYVWEAYDSSIFRKNNISVIKSWQDTVDHALEIGVDNINDINDKTVMTIFKYIMSNRGNLHETINKLKVLQFYF